MAKVSAAKIKTALAESVSTSGDWWRADCPVCLSRSGKEDRRKSFAMRPEGYYLCHKCGVRGWSKRIKEEIGSEWTRGLLGDGLESVHAAQQAAPEYKKPPAEYVALGDDTGKTAISLEWARNYLLKRGVSEDLWGPLQIGACSSGYYAGRIIVPVLSKNGQWSGFVARAVPTASGVSDRRKLGMKYLYPKGFDRSRQFFNEAAIEAHTGTDSPLIIVEGIFDAIKLWPSAVACLGKPTRHQINRLISLKNAPPYAVTLDADAYDQGWSLSQSLRLQGKRAFAIKLPPGEDPGSLEKDYLMTLVRDAHEVSHDFVSLSHLTKKGANQ